MEETAPTVFLTSWTLSTPLWIRDHFFYIYFCDIQEMLYPWRYDMNTHLFPLWSPFGLEIYNLS
ncbi:hypothetical protein Mapa_009291 [Marchantia paleacea]|nr:hypothetical protein Mapa_009291 [Marchantia paleacea]